MAPSMIAIAAVAALGMNAVSAGGPPPPPPSDWSPTTTGGGYPTQLPPGCNKGNCLRNLLRYERPYADDFCATYTKEHSTDPSDIPAFLSNCDGNPVKVSSACSCLPTDTPTWTQSYSTPTWTESHSSPTWTEKPPPPSWAPPPPPEHWTYSTIYASTIYVIEECPETVKYCPYGETTTEVFSYTTYCPEGASFTFAPTATPGEKPIQVTYSAPAAQNTNDVVSQIGDGQIQAPANTANVISQIPDGQIQAPAATGNVVSQIPDGQVQAPAGTAAGNGFTSVATGNSAPAPTYVQASGARKKAQHVGGILLAAAGAALCFL